MAGTPSDDDRAAQYYAAQNAARDRRRRIHTTVGVGIVSAAALIAFFGQPGLAIRFTIATSFIYTVGVLLEGLTRRIR